MIVPKNIRAAITGIQADLKNKTLVYTVTLLSPDGQAEIGKFPIQVGPNALQANPMQAATPGWDTILANVPEAQAALDAITALARALAAAYCPTVEVVADPEPVA